MKIYDVHSHFGPTSSGEEIDVSKLLKDMDKYGIEKVGISCLSGNSTREQNDLVYKTVQKCPDRIVGYAFINPKDPGAVEEVRKCLGEYKFKAVKFHSWKQGYYPDNRPELVEIFNEISKYDAHVQIHVGTAPLSTPYTWVEWAKKYPNIDFVFTHTGYYEFGLSTIECVKDLSNVWVETSGQMDTTVLESAVKILGYKRVVFGTDWPYKPVNVEIYKFNELNLSTEELEYIFYKNAKYLWRL